MTYTYAVLEVPDLVYMCVREKLANAGYQHAFHQKSGREVIDMHGIALAVEGTDSQQISLSIQQQVDDEDATQVRFTVFLKPGKTAKDLDSFAVERILLKFITSHIDTWARYIRDTGMKTLA